MYPVSGYMNRHAKLHVDGRRTFAEVKMQNGHVKYFPVAYNTEGTHPCWKIQDARFGYLLNFMLRQKIVMQKIVPEIGIPEIGMQ